MIRLMVITGLVVLDTTIREDIQSVIFFMRTEQREARLQVKQIRCQKLWWDMAERTQILLERRHEE